MLIAKGACVNYSSAACARLSYACAVPGLTHPSADLASAAHSRIGRVRIQVRRCADLSGLNEASEGTASNHGHLSLPVERATSAHQIALSCQKLS